MEHFLGPNYVRFYRTSNYLNTPFKNPKQSAGKPAEITVTDQTHALFGRSFPVLSIYSSRCKYVEVLYKDCVTLRIPIISTNLVEPLNIKTTKLTLASLRQLISLAEESNLCHINPKTTGKNCRST